MNRVVRNFSQGTICWLTLFFFSPKVNAWKHRFSSECMTLLHDQAFGAKMPTYATVLQLDRKLRAFPVPPVLQVAGFGSSEPRQGGFPDTVMLTLQRHIVLAIREMSKLLLLAISTRKKLMIFLKKKKKKTYFICTEVSLHGLLVIILKIPWVVHMEHP